MKTQIYKGYVIFTDPSRYDKVAIKPVDEKNFYLTKYVNSKRGAIYYIDNILKHAGKSNKVVDLPKKDILNLLWRQSSKWSHLKGEFLTELDEQIKKCEQDCDGSMAFGLETARDLFKNVFEEEWKG